MINVFILVAGSLAAGVALLLLLPLVRRRADARPVSTVSAIVVLAAVLLGGAGLYVAFSNYSWQEGASLTDSPAAMTARLAKRLAGQSGSTEEWLKLARSYEVLGQLPLAMRAYQRADRAADGKNAEALTGLAVLLVNQDVEELRGRAGRMFERALELDPGSRKALFYSAFAALGRQEPVLARQRLNVLLSDEPEPQLRTILMQGLRSAEQMESAASQAPAAGADSSAKVAVRVTLAPALAAKVPGGAPLFVIARDPSSPGPPFAVKRLAAAFPVEVELSGADAMLPTRRIAAGQKLEVVARVALGGTPTASSGDPFGQVSYHVGKDGKLNIVIDRLAP
jgi:cytochrome c-type biogenesis protein CcmH